MALTLDGKAKGTSNTGTTTGPEATLTTANSGDVIIALVYVRSGNASYPNGTVAGGSLTWTRRWRHTMTTDTGTATDLEMWYAIAASPLSSAVITSTYDIAVFRSVIQVFGISGAYTASPFDGNVGLPSFVDHPSSSNTSTHNVTFSTTNTDNFLIGGLFAGESTLVNGSTADGYTNIDSTANFAIGSDVEYKVVSTVQTSVTHSVDDGENTNSFITVIDAVTSNAVTLTGTIAQSLPHSLSFYRRLTTDITYIKADTTAYTADQIKAPGMKGTVRNPDMYGPIDQSFSSTFTLTLAGTVANTNLGTIVSSFANSYTQILNGLSAQAVTGTAISSFAFSFTQTLTGAGAYSGQISQNFTTTFAQALNGIESEPGTVVTNFGNTYHQVLFANQLNTAGNTAYYSWWFLGP